MKKFLRDRDADKNSQKQLAVKVPEITISEGMDAESDAAHVGDDS